jgi:hypothetical protein
MKTESVAEKDVWYKGGLGFVCQRCGSCCRGGPGYVWVTAEEIAAIASHLGMNSDDFSRCYVRRVGNRFSLREAPNGDCVMYERGCRAYSSRPHVCATWPFWRSNMASEQSWREMSKDCPGAGKGRLYPAEEIREICEDC